MTNLKAPVISNDGAEYWAACREDRLTFQQCSACGHRQFLSRSCCGQCLSDDLTRENAAGTGTITSYSIAYPAKGAPFVVALITLSEGVTMLSRIVDADNDAIGIGGSVTVRFVPVDGADFKLPCFTLV